MIRTFDPVDLVAAHEKAINGPSDFVRASNALLLVTHRIDPRTLVEQYLDEGAITLPSCVVVDFPATAKKIEAQYRKVQHNGRTYLFRK